MPFVYMVVCHDDTLYTGWAVDVEARVKAHNAGMGSLYCKQRRPVRLVYQEELPTRHDAQRRENAIKRMSRRKKLELIEAKNSQYLASDSGW
jgi:putative endonuclease